MIDDEELSRRLRVWAGEALPRVQSTTVEEEFELAPTSTPSELHRRANQQNRGHGRRQSIERVVASVAVAAAVVAGAAAIHEFGAPNSSDVTRHVTRAAALVDGTSIEATGQVVISPRGGVTLCKPGPTAAVLYASPHIASCGATIDLRGVEPGDLKLYTADDGSRFADATVIGTYHESYIQASKIEQPARYVRPPKYLKPACNAPTDGWPVSQPGSVDIAVAQAYVRAHPDNVGAWAVDVGPSQTVAYVLTSGDTGQVYSALGSTYGATLCVAHSAYTEDQLSSAEDSLQQIARDPASASQNITVDRTLTANAQYVIRVTASVVSAELARAINELPEGIVQVDAWLSEQH